MKPPSLHESFLSTMLIAAACCPDLSAQRDRGPGQLWLDL